MLLHISGHETVWATMVNAVLHVIVSLVIAKILAVA